MKKVLFAAGVFLIAFAVPITVYSLVSRSADFDVRDQAAEEETVTSPPQIISLPITEAAVGEKYSYKIKVIDGDTNDEDLEYDVNELPDWLEWNEELLVFQGVPSNQDAGSHDVEISVSDGKWLDTQKFRISVDDGSGVLGLSDTSRSSSSDESRSDSTTQSSTSSSEDLADHGLSSGATKDSNDSTAAVLAAASSSDSELPDTAVFGSVVIISLALGAICLGLFLWADSRWDLMGKLRLKLNYESGRQIQLTTQDGRIIKKRKSVA